MIVIQEIIPRKLSGLSSLLVYPGANKEAVSFIMSLDAKYEFKKEYAWEIPAYELAKTLDALTPLDDVVLKLLVETESDRFQSLTEDEVKEFKFAPFAHQIDAINFCVSKKRTLLLDSMGVG